MTTGAPPQSGHLSGGSDAKRNFILQQGFSEPAAETCSRQYSALLFQPRLIGLWVIAATILKSPALFFALAVVLWWSAAFPRLNPFEVIYNRTLAPRNGMTLGPAPAPRRFAQFLAGSFAIAIGVSLLQGWRAAALVLEAFLLIAIGLLVFGGFCLGSFLFHLLRGRAGFARRTLPWGSGD
jgi:hypothetical protein